MFDWALFLIIIAVCVPGVLIVFPQTLKATLKRLPPDKRPPTTPVLIAISALQSLTFVTIASAVGTTLAHRVDLSAPFFEALASGGAIVDALKPQLVPSLMPGWAGA